MRGKQVKPTQEQQILELLKAETRVRDMRLMALCNSGDYMPHISRLRKKYNIVLIYTLEGNFYSLIGERNNASNANVITQLQTA